MKIATSPDPASWCATTGLTCIGMCAVDEPCAEQQTAAQGSRRARRKHSVGNGFTLIELLIAITIMGVLTSIALPSFQGYLQKARRAEVMVLMMQVQLSQLRWRANSNGYGSLADIGVPSISTGGHYTLQLNNDTPDGYEVLAIAIGSQAQDSNCRYMKFSMAEANVQRNSGPAESVANSVDTNRRCWNQ